MKKLGFDKVINELSKKLTPFNKWYNKINKAVEYYTGPFMETFNQLNIMDKGIESFIGGMD